MPYVPAMDPCSGAVIWKYQDKTGGIVPIEMVQGVIYLGSISIGANIIAPAIALRASDGKLLWNYTPHTSYRQLLPVVGEDIVLIALQDGSVEALNASNGSLLWRRAMNS
jgi:outer membrane protein assembly factor BamB